MARTKRLTAKTVEHAPPGKHSDGAGLTLVVKPTGRRSWVMRVTVDGKRRDIGIGGYPTVSLADARQKAAELRAEAVDGGDPAQAKRAPAAPTFAEAARRVHEMNRPRWRNDRAARQWLASLETYAFPTLGELPLNRIERSDVLAILLPIWPAKPETARRVRQRIRKVFEYGTAHGWIDLNPAGEVINGALPTMPKVKNHQRALHYSEVPAALDKVAASEASDASKLALAFIVLTAARSGEVRNATWDKIDIDAAEWRIPAERMKAGTDHVVPLSRQALDVLESARALDDGSGLIFPSPLRPGHPLSWEALLKVLSTNGVDSTAHGFRSSFRTWTLECTSTPWAVAEAALAHTLGTRTETAYIRSDLRAQRAKLMQSWADFASAGHHARRLELVG